MELNCNIFLQKFSTNQDRARENVKMNKNGFRRQFRDSDCKGCVRLNDSRLDNAATEKSNDNAMGTNSDRH